MRLTATDRIGFQDVLFDTREASRFAYLCIPLTVRDDYDVDTGSGDNMSEGNGLGEVAADWHIYALRVHFRSVDNMLMVYGHVPPGVQIGDALVNFGPRDLAAFQQAEAAENSYLLIDSVTYRIISITTTGMGQIEEYCIDARSFTPDFRAQGY